MHAAVVIPAHSRTAPLFGALPAPVPLYPQIGSQWCWLACAQMVCDTAPRALGLLQCNLAVNYIAGAVGCCARLTSSCDRPGSPANIGKIYSNHGVSYSVTSVPIGEPALQTALANGYLVEVGWQTLRQGHVALVVGTHLDAAGNHRYLVNDPSPPNVGQIRDLDFAALKAPPLPNTGAGKWQWTYTWSDLH